MPRVKDLSALRTKDIICYQMILCQNYQLFKSQ